MIGIDITKISRFKSSKNTFIKKILHPEEILEYNLSNNKEKFLAARWSIKEALFKADNENFHFNKINIKVENRVFKLPGYMITTSSEGDYYLAWVKKEK